MSFVQVERLWVAYGSFVAVGGISFEIPKGEVFGFIGPNGAGKTSTMKAMTTLLKPRAGRILIGGVDVAASPQKARPLFGYMPDEFGVYDDLTVAEYLGFFAAAYGLEWKRRERIVADVLELTDLAGKRDAQVNALSRGMKQRLGLARVLVHDPELLVLDEPASGLDPRARIEMRELLKELRRMGKTIVISSHILPELAELCDRIGIIEQGKLVAEGPVAEIFKRLGAKRAIHVQLKEADDALLSKLKLLPGVASLKQDVDRLVFEVDEELMPSEELNARLHELGAKVRMLQPQAMDMESAFLRLTEGKLQ